MNKKQVKVGMKVVVNDLPDATIYNIEELDGFVARLSYMVGDKKVSGGCIDISCLQKPKANQKGN